MKNSDATLRFNYLFSFCLYFFILGYISYNNDWNAYLELYDGVKPTHDVLYSILFGLGRLVHIKYELFYMINQSLIYFLLLYFAYKCRCRKIILLTILSILFLGPNLSILLRYYFSYSLLLVALYLKIVEQKKWSKLLFILSLTAHIGILVFVPFYLFYDKIKKITNNVKIIISVLLYLLIDAVAYFCSIIGINVFDLYIKEDRSSFIGGLFVLFPYLLLLFYFVYINKMLTKNNVYMNNEKISFLYNLLVYSLFFVIPALYLQIIVIRIIQPLIYVGVLYFICILSFLSVKKIFF